jgi:hypothetical protein
MKVNKKALYALAAYYDAIGLTGPATIAERRALTDLVIPCLNDSFNEAELYRSFQHGEFFFKQHYMPGFPAEENGIYCHKFNDKNIAKLLRYIARTGKFPRARALKHV